VYFTTEFVSSGSRDTSFYMTERERESSMWKIAEWLAFLQASN